MVQARRALAAVEHITLHEVALGVGVIDIPRGELGEAVLHAGHANVHAGALGDGTALRRSEAKRTRKHLAHSEVGTAIRKKQKKGAV